MILAAGDGRRLRPLTETVPKVLVPVLGAPLLDRLAGYLWRGGVRALAVNGWHLADAVAAHVEGMAPPSGAEPVRFLREGQLLGTGGAVVHAAAFWGESPLLVWNGDIVADLAPGALWDLHAATGAAATLAVGQRPTSSHLLLDGAGRLCGVDSPRRGGRRLARDPQGPTSAVAFHGVSMLAAELRREFPAGGAFDLVDALLDAAAAGADIRGHDPGPGMFWGSSGTPDQLRDLEAGLTARPDLLERWRPLG